MSTRQGRIQVGRDDLRRTQQVVNELWDRTPPPGVAYFPAIEAISRFYCVGASDDTNGVALARADGDVLALGVLVQDVGVRETAYVRTCGRINGAGVPGQALNSILYVADDGTLTLTPPGGISYEQSIAVAINASDIFVIVGVPQFTGP